MTRWIQGSGLFLLAVLVAVPASGQDVERTFHETFAVQDGMRLRLVNGDGDVTIRSWDRDELEVDVYYHAQAGLLGFGQAEAFTVDFAEDGDRIVVTGHDDGEQGLRLGLFRHRVLDYTYTIRAPAYLDLEIRGDDGDVDIREWAGSLDAVIDDGDLILEDFVSTRIEIRMEDGDVSARGIRGELILSTDDGDVQMTDVVLDFGTIRLEDGDLLMRDAEGSLEIVSDDGSVRLESLVSDDLNVRTEDGRIEVALIGGDPPQIDLETDDGSIEILIGPGISAAFSISTDDADVHVELPEADDVDVDESRASGTIRGGTGQIRIRTSDGRVTLGEIS